MDGTVAGEELLLDAATVGQEGKLISRAADDLGQHHSGAGRLVELSDAELKVFGGLQLALARRWGARFAQFEGGSRETAGVEDDPDLLASLGGELAGDEFGAACGCGPGDVANLVATLVIAQTLELAPDSAETEAAFLQLYLPGAHEVEGGVVSALFGCGEDANLLLGIADGPAFDEP